MGAEAVIHLLARRPERGAVKTRLAAECGEQSALAIYRRLLGHCLATLQSLPVPWRVHWCGRGDPDWSLDLPPKALPGEEQPPGDLGQRMAHILEQGALRGAGTQLLIGADCPWITSGDLLRGLAALQEHDAVIGSAEDGGYWCIGAQTPHPALFPSTCWGGEMVAEDTRRSLERAGLSWQELRCLPDVDHMSDWERWLKESKP